MLFKLFFFDFSLICLYSGKENKYNQTSNVPSTACTNITLVIVASTFLSNYYLENFTLLNRILYYPRCCNTHWISASQGEMLILHTKTQPIDSKIIKPQQESV